MHPLLAGMLASVPLVFLLGLRHGLDPDHVVAIEGLAHSYGLRDPALARRAGWYFALGHGLVVTVLAACFGALARHIAVPPWLAPVGTGASIALMFVLSAGNLQRHKAQELLTRSMNRAGPGRRRGVLLMLICGGVFAVAFDTVSQITTWGLSLASGGALRGVLLGALFTAGMMTVDGIWGAAFARTAAVAALRRPLAWAIALAALATAALELLPHRLLPLPAAITTVVVALPALLAFIAVRHRAGDRA